MDTAKKRPGLIAYLWGIGVILGGLLLAASVVLAPFALAKYLFF